MRMLASCSLLAALVVMSLPAQASDTALCQYRLQYDIEQHAGTTRLVGHDGAPELTMSGDRLWIAGREQALTDVERQRFADYHAGLIRFTADASRVALQGIDLAVEAASVALASMSGKDDVDQQLHRFDRLRGDLVRRYDGQSLSQKTFGADFDHELDTAINDITQAAVTDMSVGMARMIAMSLFAPSKMEARAARVEQQVDARMSARGQQLEQRVDALCGDLRRLDVLENSLGRFDVFVRDMPSI